MANNPINDNFTWLYNTLTERGVDLGSIEDTASAINSNADNRRWLYDEGVYQGLDMGSYEEFEEAMGFTKLQSSATLTPSEASEGAEQIAITQEPVAEKPIAPPTLLSRESEAPEMAEGDSFYSPNYVTTEAAEEAEQYELDKSALKSYVPEFKSEIKKKFPRARMSGFTKPVQLGGPGMSYVGEDAFLTIEDRQSISELDEKLKLGQIKKPEYEELIKVINQRAIDKYNEQYSEDTMNASAALHLMAKAQDRIKVVDSRTNSKIGNFFRGLKYADYAGINPELQLVDAYTSFALLNKLAENPDAELSESEEYLLQAIVTNNAVDDTFQTNMAERIGAGLPTNMAYMAQFALTGGVGGAAGAAAKKGTKWVIKQGMKNAERKLYAKGFKGLLQKGVDRTLNTVVPGVIGASVAATAQTALDPVGVSAEAMKRMAGTPTYAMEDGIPVATGEVANRKGAGEAWREAFATKWAENLSERSGESLGIALGAGKAVGKTAVESVEWMGNAVDKLSDFTKSIQSTKVGDIVTRAAMWLESKDLGFDKVAKAVGWNGTVEEFYEEQVNTVLNAWFVGDEDLSALFDSERQLETLLSVGVVGGAMRLVEAPVAIEQRAQIRSEKQNLKRTLTNIEKAHSSQADKEAQAAIASAVENGTISDVVSTLATLNRRGHWDESTAQDYLNYANARIMLNMWRSNDQRQASKITSEIYAETEARTHKQSGAIVVAEYTDASGNKQNVDIIDGVIIRDADKIDSALSDRSVIIRKQDGTTEMVSSKSLGNIVDEISPDVYRDNLHWATQQDLGAIFKTEYKSSMNRHGVHYYEDGTLDYYNAEPSQIALSLIDERGSIDEALAYAQQNANGIQQSAQVSAEGGERVTLEAQNMASKWGTVVELLGQMQAKAAATGGVVTPEVTADAEDAAAVGNNLRPGDRVRLTVDSGEVVDATIGARTPEGSVIVDFDEEVTVAGNKGQSLELTPEVVSAMTFVEEVQEGEEELEAEQNPEQDDVTTNADYALSRIPMGPNGRNWEAAKPLDVANAKVAEHNGDYEAAANFAQQMVDRITAEIDKLAASPLSVEDPTNADMVAAADNERAEQLASLAEKAAFWAEVVENINAAKAGFEASSGSASATSEATIEESVATDTTEAPAQPEGSMPMLEDGNPDFVSAGVERTAQFLADELGEDAAGFVQDNIAEAQKMLEDATAKKATSTNFAQRKQEATAIAEERAAAQARLDFWNAVAESYSAPQDTKAEEEGIPSYNREDEVAEETTGTTPEAEQTAPNEQSGAPAKEATSEMSDAAQERKAFYEQRLQEQGEISPRMPRGKYKLEDYLRGKDEPNPSLRHILYQDGFAVATDAFQLVADKEAYQSDKEGKWVDPQGNVVEPTTKLAWKKVVDSRADPKGAVATGISPEKALLFVGGLKAKLKEEWQRRKDAGEKVGSFEKFISDTAVMLPLPNGEVVAVNLSQLEKFARAAQHLGATDIMGRANDKPVFVQTDKGVALLMPVFLDYYNKALDYYAYTDLSVEQNTEESANFVESNAPTQEEVAPEAKSEESEGVTPERATEAEVTTEMIESSDLDETVKLGAIDYLNGNVNMATTLAYEIAKEYVRNNPQKRAADSTDAERAQLGEGTNDAGIVASEQSRGDGRELDTPEDGGAVSDGHGVRSEVSQNDMAEPSGSRGDTEMGERESSSDEVSSSGTDRGSRGDSTGEQGASVRNTRGRKRSGKGVSEQNEERRGTTRRANDSGDSDTRSVGEKKADDLIAEGLQELKDIFANPMGDAKGALLDATSIIGMFGVNAVKIMGASAKIGIGLIQKGYYKFQKWGAMMHQQLDDIFHNHTQLTDELIDEFINAMWDYPFKFRGEVRKISEWASLLEAEELRAMMRMGIEEKRKLQKNAEGEPTILGDIDNIRRSLPFLLPAQQEDVEKAEVQFFDESHRDAAYGYGKGYMFTNGTGTGKTYTGLGIIKRFIKQGKGRILIVTASGEKIDDWVRDAENLGITATRLEDTKSKGKGVVVTQFANLRQNLALLQDEFDLVVYDESHKLMENQSGIDTKAAGVHYMVTNRDAEQAILRTLQDHPYWVEPRGLEDEYKELNSLLGKFADFGPCEVVRG